MGPPLNSPKTPGGDRARGQIVIPPQSQVCVPAFHSSTSSSVSSQLLFLRLLVSHTPVVLGRVDIRVGKARRRSLCPV
jgi:hypothetical protein